MLPTTSTMTAGTGSALHQSAAPAVRNAVGTAEGLYYPHIYGPLNLSAVTAVVPFPCGSDGTFALPPDVPDDDEADSADA